MGISLKETYLNLLSKGGYGEIEYGYKSLNDLRKLLNDMNEIRSSETDEIGQRVLCKSHTDFSLDENKNITLKTFNTLLSNDSITELTCPSKITYTCNCESFISCECDSRTLTCDKVSEPYTTALCSTRVTTSKSCDCNSVDNRYTESIESCECNSVTNLVTNGYYYYSKQPSCECNGKEYSFVDCSCNNRASTALCQTRVSSGITYMCTTRTTWNLEYAEPVYSTDFLCTSRTSSIEKISTEFLCPSRTTSTISCDCQTRVSYRCSCDTRSTSLCQSRVGCVCNSVCDCNTVKIFE